VTPPVFGHSRQRTCGRSTRRRLEQIGEIAGRSGTARRVQIHVHGRTDPVIHRLVLPRRQNCGDVGRQGAVERLPCRVDGLGVRHDAGGGKIEGRFLRGRGGQEWNGVVGLRRGRGRS